MEKLKVTILGSSGFIGKNLVELLSKQEYKLRLVARSHTTYPLDKSADYEIKAGDITNEYFLEEAIAGSDIVIHLASASFPGSPLDEPLADVNLNLIPTLKIIDCCKKREIKQLIYASSGGAIYGLPENIPIREDDLAIPISSYGVTKLAIEHYLRLISLKTNMNVCVLRISNPYGKYQNVSKGQGIVDTIAYRVANNIKISIWGDGNVVRDYIYVGDVVDAIQTVINNTNGYSCYNIGSETGLSINQLLDIFREVCLESFQVEYLKGRKVDVPVNILSATKFAKDFKWRCRGELKKEIPKLIEYYKNGQ